MKLARAFLVAGMVAVVPFARAVYAPIPDQDKGKEWVVTLNSSVSSDNNIFGAQHGAISSVVYEFSPKVAFNGSLTDQTFASASYQLTLDHFDNRPGDKTLDSHEFDGRIAHAFTQATTIDISDSYSIAKNPESLLAGIAINTDQSYKRNELDASFTTSLAEKTNTSLKIRSVNYSYDNAVLGRSLDRTENLYGLAGSFDVLPEMKAVGEYRHQVIDYRSAGPTKDKQSDFLIGGLDYSVAKKLTATGRLGCEWRSRDAEPDTTAPYAEFSLKYDYAENSFLTAGYVYTLEETSNVVLYTDTKVNRLFLNVQHAVSALVVASGSITYEPSQLQGRRGLPDADETTTRLGLALTWLPTKNWALSVNYDHDNVDSNDISRGQERDRFGATARYTF